MRTLALSTLIASIAISALVGIYFLLAGQFGELELRILLTAVALSLLSILAMASGAAFERGRLGWLPHVGALASVVSFAMFMIYLWLDIEDDPWWQTAASLAILGGAAAHACLLSLAALALKFRWVQLLGLVTAFWLAAMLIFVIWTDVDSEALFRVVGVLSILVGAVTIAVPVLHRMSDPPRVSAAAGATPPSVRFCVACGAALAGTTSAGDCRQCGIRFRVDFSDSRSVR